MDAPDALFMVFEGFTPRAYLITAVFSVDLVLGWVLFKLVSRRRGTPSNSAQSALPYRTPRSSGRGRAHHALLIDINNIRGGLRFDRDVDEMVACLVHRALKEPEAAYVVLEVDHGPQACTFLIEQACCLICFAGPQMEADDTIVCGVHYCAFRGERVLVASSDTNLRTRCRAAASPPQDGVAVPTKRNPLLDFLHRTSFSDLPAPGSRRGGPFDELLLGNEPLSKRASAAVRTARREKSGKKSELTAMRIEQAEVLFRRLEAAVEQGSKLVSVPRDEQTTTVALTDGCFAHGAWLNNPSGLKKIKQMLKVQMQAYWDNQLFN
eukprot:scaffold104107_cov26-Tisochrysis_lutea.AAC.1